TAIVLLSYHRSLPEVLEIPEDTCTVTTCLPRKGTVGQAARDDQYRRCDCTRTHAPGVPDFLGYAIRISLVESQ
ncbi:hypothetical protein ASPBRDRAFT_137774, partial [Aspergillus brasiliensis CBS 101740]